MSTESATSQPLQWLCVKCGKAGPEKRAIREMKNPEEITMKNKKPAVKGTCGTCGTAMFAMGLTIPKIREKNATWKAAAASGGQVEGQAPALAPSATSG